MGILAINSSVAYGHVGNGAAVFALRRLGLDVWPVATVLFSNHAGYGDVGGRVVDPEIVDDLISGLGRRGAFTRCQGILSGYLGRPETGDAVVRTVRIVRDASPTVLYCCDPVLGDGDKGLYVAEAQATKVRDKLIPTADVVTPNLFELGYLTGLPVDSAAHIQAAASALRSRGPRLVVVTSVPPPIAPAGEIGVLAVDESGGHLVSVPREDTVAKGTGDLLAALLLGHMVRGVDPVAAVEVAVAAVHAVAAATAKAGAAELRLVASQDALVTPPRPFLAQALF